MNTSEIVLKNGVVIPNNIFLAPMAGWTDVGFRSLAKKFGAGLCFTEMISAKALLYDNKKTLEMLATEQNEKPIAVQLFGNDPEVFEKVLKLKCLEKFDIIDLNMGCPAPKIVKNGEGSFLMTEIEKARKIIRSCIAQTNKPVSVKFRKGWDETTINAVEFAQMCEEEGVSFITVHGRTRQQQYSGKNDLNIIKSVVQSVKIPVILNGDITTEDNAKFALKFTGASGVMIGRGALGNLELFAKCSNKNVKISKKVQIIEHFAILSKYFSEKFVVLTMRKHISCYVKGMKNSAIFLQQIMQIDKLEELKEAVNKFFGDAE